nr:YafY family transcriptional regulator [candidate division Zixibacteria bacterium]
MAKYDRLLYILNLLRTRRSLNAGRLARECGVTERTVYRDIVALSEANIPIYYDRGYKYASDNFLPPLNFNIDEYLTLITALESSPLYKGGPGYNLIKSIKGKIEACLPPAVKEKKKYSRPKTRIDIKSTQSVNFSDKFYAAVERGIENHQVLELTYNSIQSGIITRPVEPYFLIFIEKAFYFVAFCQLRKALRTFRIDRILKISVTDEHFHPRPDINPAEYFAGSWGVFSGDPVEIEAVFSGKAARIVGMSRHHPGEKVSRFDNDRIKYQVTVRGIEEICRWLLGYGGEVRVIKPDILKNEIKRRAKAILQTYK